MGKAIESLKDIKIVKTFTNIWRIEDLRTRILITLMFVAIYRLGSYIVLPGVDTEALQGLRNQRAVLCLSLICFQAVLSLKRQSLRLESCHTSLLPS